MNEFSRSTRRLILAALVSACLATAQTALAQAPSVVVSIKPIHSLVAAVMEGVGAPDLLLDGGESPHAYSLLPSEAAMVSDADIVFWVGRNMENFLERPLAALAPDAHQVALAEAPGLSLLAPRAGGVWGDDAGHDHNHDHDHDHDHDADSHHDASDGGPAWDPHVWLDPANAAAMVGQIAATLAQADPANADLYRANADAVVLDLDRLTADLTARLAPAAGRGFIVYHDAYQYFETRFGLTPVGSVTVSPDRQPGAQRLAALRERLDRADVACLFAEPQFEPRLVAVLAEGAAIRVAELDPIGVGLEPGPGLYPRLLTAMADAIAACLAESS